MVKKRIKKQTNRQIEEIFLATLTCSGELSIYEDTEDKNQADFTQ